MSIQQVELARRLREAREASGLKQEDAARHLGIARSSLAQIELGNRAVSSLELDRLAYLYGRDIRDFLAPEFSPEESLVALFRADSGVAARDEVVKAIGDCIALARELAGLEDLLGLGRTQLGAPFYSGSVLHTKWQAIEQGMRAAVDERRRLGLAVRPVEDAASLLESEGVRTALLDLPEDVSGLTLMDPALSHFVAVNRRHSVLRRRFSWVHEYAHVLFDRQLRGTLSRASNRDELLEVRANAFAACLLMPEEGVRDFVGGLGKGQPSRERLEVFDGVAAVPAETRAEPGSQRLQIYDVVLLAHHFGVSRTAALYRLRNLHLLSQAELDKLLAEEAAGQGKRIGRLLGLAEPDHDAGQKELLSRLLGLALEAYRREKISRDKLCELAASVGVSGEDFTAILEGVGFVEDEGNSALLPEGFE
ncbi:MAG TPA: XRE family transcriptional regulator [Thermoanaerobaculia bacterium]|nr:XRE family transcriptional regulator [Thermoanaerobaculia bacterium]